MQSASTPSPAGDAWTSGVTRKRRALSTVRFQLWRRHFVRRYFVELSAVSSLPTLHIVEGRGWFRPTPLLVILYVDEHDEMGTRKLLMKRLYRADRRPCLLRYCLSAWSIRRSIHISLNSHTTAIPPRLTTYLPRQSSLAISLLSLLFGNFHERHVPRHAVDGVDGCSSIRGVDETRCKINFAACISFEFLSYGC